MFPSFWVGGGGQLRTNKLITLVILELASQTLWAETPGAFLRFEGAISYHYQWPSALLMGADGLVMISASPRGP